MVSNEQIGKTKVGISVSCQAAYGEATFKRIVEDAVFFRQQAKGFKSDDSDVRRYARIVIILMAFYLESLSNLIFEKLANAPLDNLDNRTDLPEPLRKLRAAHQVCRGGELSLDIGGVRDVFTIRNKIIAHPVGRAQLQVAGAQLGCLDRHISYDKFKDFPVVYSGFAVEHADKVLTEVRDFLVGYLGLLAGKITKEQFKEWWPSELDQWHKSVVTH